MRKVRGRPQSAPPAFIGVENLDFQSHGVGRHLHALQVSGGGHSPVHRTCSLSGVYVRERFDAFFISSGVFFLARRTQLATLAIGHGVPTIFAAREWAEAGGLASYGTNFTDMRRQAGVYAGRILNGAKPADLPVMQSTKFELVINLKTAKTLGLKVPQRCLWQPTR